MALLQTLIEPGMTIADIGANVGFYAVQMGEWVGAGGRILAFEPDPFTFELLQRRTSAAAPANIEVRQFALGDARGTATLYCSAYNRADNRVGQRHDEPNVEAIEIEVRTLDEYLAERGSARRRRHEDRRAGARGQRAARREADHRQRRALDLAGVLAGPSARRRHRSGRRSSRASARWA